MRSPRYPVPQNVIHPPEHNLPGRKESESTLEDLLIVEFAWAYLNNASRIHHGSTKSNTFGARQVAVNGFGIADFVSVSAKTGLALGNQITHLSVLRPSDLTVRAFEVKIANWRKGMMQACRYRFYANAAILVLPANKCRAAIPYLCTFRRIRVGLWGFDAEAKRIIDFYTPRPEAAREPKYWGRVINTISSLQEAQ